MKKLALLLMVITAWAICESQGQAQVGYVTYYQPVMAQPVAVVSPPPVYYSSYYAPAPTIVAAPAPVYAAPVYYQQPVRVRTRYRPFLGGTVTRIRPGFRRAYYAPAVYAY